MFAVAQRFQEKERVVSTSPRIPKGANSMSNKHNLVLYLDKEIVEKSKAIGFNLSRTFFRLEI